METFRTWITLVVAQRFGSAGRELELQIRKEEEGKMTTLFGSRTAKQLVPIFDTLSDPERIAAVADAVLECETAEECIVRAREAAGMP